MDVGIFKATRMRLMVWVVVPPVLAASVAMGAHLLHTKSRWTLVRAHAVGEVLPQLVEAKTQADELLTRFQSDKGRVESEDQLISFLQAVAHRAGFVVDSIKVDRGSSKGGSVHSLVASVKGTGTFEVIQALLDDVRSSQRMLSEKTVKLSRIQGSETGEYRADLTFELLLFGKAGGSK